MKKIIFAFLSLSLISTSAQAACVVPSPICAIAGGAVLIGHLIAGNQNKELKEMVISKDKAEITDFTRLLLNDDRYSYAISNYREHEDIRYQRRMFSKSPRVQLWGVNMLEQPRFRAHLEAVEAEFVAFFGEERVAAAYGSKYTEDGSKNLNYYFMLISDLEIVGSNFFVVR